jgi:exocyst complex component 4
LGIIRSISFSERLRLVPDVLESLISEKRLLQAAVLLVRSLKTIKKQDMLDIGAVSDLRAYLIGQESVSTIFPLVTFLLARHH